MNDLMKNSASTAPCCDVFLGTILAYSRYKDLGLHECNGAMESFGEYAAEMANGLGAHITEIVDENGILSPTYPLGFLEDAYVAWLAEDGTKLTSFATRERTKRLARLSA